MRMGSAKGKGWSKWEGHCVGFCFTTRGIRGNTQFWGSICFSHSIIIIIFIKVSLIYTLTKVSPGKQRGYYTQPYYRVPAIPHRCQCPSVSIKRGSDVLVARVALDPTSLTLVHQGRHLDLCVLAESERQYSKTFIFTVTNFYYCISFQFRMVGRKRITGETASISVFWTIYWVSYFLETTHELFFFFF